MISRSARLITSADQARTIGQLYPSRIVAAISVRSGGQPARHDAKTIAAQGDWRPNSDELYRYMQIVDQWSDNALKGIGL